MFSKRIARRIAAAALAVGLAVGGLSGAGAFDTSDHPADAPSEEAAARLKVTVSYGGYGGSFETNGATWS